MKQNQQLAILFADISESTRLYETIGNEQARDVTSRCINLLSEVTAKYQGTVVKTIGDELMCTFPTTDHAAQAAVHMHEMVISSAHLLRNLHIRVGFHFGEVICEEGDVFGDAVNLAARMAAQAKADQIITTGETLDTMGAKLRLCCRELTSAIVKGKSAPVTIVELTWGEDGALTLQEKRDLETVCNPEMTSGQLSFGDQIVEINEHSPVVTIGRDGSNTLSVLDSMSSRVHARVECHLGQIILVDQSTNGTFILTSHKDRAFVHLDKYRLQRRGVIGLGREVNANDPLAIHFSC